MTRVFVSYASEDLVWARKVSEWLNEDGHKVFLAHDMRDGIAVGEEWERRLQDELRRATTVICVVTSAYVASEWCLVEVATAQAQRSRLLPLRAEPGVVHSLLRSVQHLDLTQNPDDARLCLIEALRQVDDDARPSLIEALRLVDAAWPDDRLLGAPVGIQNRKCTGGTASVQQFASCDEVVPCGRDSAAAKLLTWLDPTVDGGPTTIAVTGLPGVGKTTLARYAGSKAMDQFRGGAVYVNMNGYDPDPQARTVGEQVYGPLLLALGVDGWRGLSDSDAGPAGAIYQRKLAEWSEQGQSVLLMLDNVSDFKQIDGLLSDHRAHRIVITSRNADFLTELRRLRTLQLEILDIDDAVTVLENIIHERCPDDQRLSREPDKAGRLAKFCGRLPQALELVGGLLAEHTGMPWMDELIRRLEASPLAGLGPVETAFRLYWQYLKEHDDQVARLLLLLSVNPGPDISTKAAAVLGGMAENNVYALLQVLCRAHLVNYDYHADRLWMHDLVRHCVDEFAVTDLSTDDQEVAFGRLLSHYQEHATHLARQAGWFLLRHSRPSPKAGPGDEPVTPTWSGRIDALRCFETERLNLLGCLRDATDRVHGVPESELRSRLALIDAMAGYLRNNGPWNTAEQVHCTAVSIAAHLRDMRAQAIALNHLGITYRLRGKRKEADEVLKQARKIFCGLSDTRTSLLGQANTLNERGIVANDTGRHTDEKRHYEHAQGMLMEAWNLYCHPDVRDVIGKANSAKNLGVALGRLDKPDAAEWLNRSLANYKEIDDVLGVVEVCNHLGFLHLDLNDRERALAVFREAVKMMDNNEMSSLLEEARADEGIGCCQVRNGEFLDAMKSFEKAKDLYSRIGADQDRDRMTNNLDKLRGYPDV